MYVLGHIRFTLLPATVTFPGIRPASSGEFVALAQADQRRHAFRGPVKRYRDRGVVDQVVQPYADAMGAYRIGAVRDEIAADPRQSLIGHDRGCQQRRGPCGVTEQVVHHAGQPFIGFERPARRNRIIAIQHLAQGLMRRHLVEPSAQPVELLQQTHIVHIECRAHCNSFVCNGYGHCGTGRIDVATGSPKIVEMWITRVSRSA